MYVKIMSKHENNNLISSPVVISNGSNVIIKYNQSGNEEAQERKKEKNT